MATNKVVYSGRTLIDLTGDTVTEETLLMGLYPYSYTLSSVRIIFWLRDVVSSARFAYVGGLGDTAYSNASGSFGVRPVYKLFYFFNLFSQPIKLSGRIDLFCNIRYLMSHHIFDSVLIHAIFFCHRDEVFTAVMRTVFRI